MIITKKSRHEISLMRSAGCIVAEALYALKDAVKPGISTFELDEIAEKVVLKNHAYPSFKGYNGFPGTICSSVNEQVVHGIPSKDIILKEGDIISIDMGACYKGLHGDSAITVPVGTVADDVLALLDITEKSLYAGIEKAVVGNYLEDISGAVEDVAKTGNYGIVRQYGGHGIGRELHEAPFVFNYRTGNKGMLLKSGMTICVEPMLNLGCDDVYVLEDDWTVVTKDAKPSAHFEHTIYVSDNGPEILTKLA